VSPILVALFPDFLLLLTGGVIRHHLVPTVWQAVDKLNFVLLFPALIFISALRSPSTVADLSAMGIGVWAGMLFACSLGWLVRHWGPERFLDFAGMWQTTWRFNTAIAIVAVQALPEQYQGLMSIAIGLAVPVANILAISALAREQGANWRALIRQVFGNPFLIASIAGVTCSMLSIALLDAIMIAIGKLAGAAVPLALLSIGAAVNWKALICMDRFEVSLNIIKLVILPASTWFAAGLLDVAAGPKLVLTIFAALPTASAAHVLASAYGADRERVATVIAQSTLLGCVTLPIWLMLVS
jgi:predicted permease